MTSTPTRLTLIAAFSLFAFHAQAEDSKLRVSIFPDAQNLALFIAEDQGFFKKRGLEVEIGFTPNSIALREGLVNGSHQIVHAAARNGAGAVMAFYEDFPYMLWAGAFEQRMRAIGQPFIASTIDIDTTIKFQDGKTARIRTTSRCCSRAEALRPK